jgi:hypothetical protein
MADDFSDTSILLASTNKLLKLVRILSKPLMSIEELCRVSSSLFVAVFEALFDMRVEQINRRPKNKSDYIQNAQLVVDHLSERV